MQLGTFLAMGGYGPYVWSAYGVAFLGLMIPLWQTYSLRKQLDKNLG